MNGEPLPADPRLPGPARRRRPVRLRVGDEVARRDRARRTWEEFDGYWVPRGWSKEGPIKTPSRIDVPRSGATVDAGPQAIAGVAWAPERRHRQGRGAGRRRRRGSEAQLGDAASDNTWVQWYLPWDATSGEHTIRVRATNAEGETQTEERRRPAPDGATGWHTRTVRVR